MTTDSRRRRASRLSVAAALVTTAIWLWAVAAHGVRDNSWLVWMASIVVPPVALSVAAAVQYRRGRGTGAGAAAAVVYWLMMFLLLFRAGPLYLIGGILQTVAWYVGRPVFRDTEQQDAPV